MRRRSIFGLVGAFAASALPFGLHTAEADGKNRPGGAVTFFKWVPTVSGTTILTRDASEVNVVNSTAETELFSYELPAGVLGSDRAIRLAVAGIFHNQSGGLVVYTLRIKLGATTLWEDPGFTVNSSVNIGVWRIDLEIDQIAVNSQVTQGIVRMGARNVATSGYGALNGNVDVDTAIFGEAAEDESTNLTITVTIQMDTASASSDMIKKFAALELL